MTDTSNFSHKVNSVTDFGAFVDCGVGTNGLIHVSQIVGSVDPGQVVDVRVVSIELDRKRLGLSMRGVQEVKLAAEVSAETRADACAGAAAVQRHEPVSEPTKHKAKKAKREDGAGAGDDDLLPARDIVIVDD